MLNKTIKHFYLKKSSTQRKKFIILNSLVILSKASYSIMPINTLIQLMHSINTHIHCVYVCVCMCEYSVVSAVWPFILSTLHFDLLVFHVFSDLEVFFCHVNLLISGLEKPRGN